MKPLPPQAKTFDYGDKYKGYQCPQPITRFQLTPDNSALPCCYNWMTIRVGDWTKLTIKQIWNSKAFNIFRKSTLVDGSFRYCDEKRCPRMQDPDNLLRLNPEEQKRYERWRKGERIPIGTVNASLDQACQLRCPSCRTGLIMERVIPKHKKRPTKELLELFNSGQVESLFMSGSADPLVSPTCKFLLAHARGKNGQKIQLLTNGLKFTENWWADNPHLHDQVSSVKISMDAGTKKTYEKVRLGGKWEILIRNLDFLATLDIPVVLHMVVQRDNVREILDMMQVALARGFRCSFNGIVHWQAMAKKEYIKKNVANPEHPDHKILLANLRDIPHEHVAGFGNLTGLANRLRTELCTLES